MNNIHQRISFKSKDSIAPSKIQADFLTKEQIHFEKILEEKDKDIYKLQHIIKKIDQELQQKNDTISLMTQKIKKNTSDKCLEIAMCLVRRVLPLITLIKEKEKEKECKKLNLEMDILEFHIKLLVRDLTHRSDSLVLLTPSEVDVASRIAKKATSKQIASQLFIAVNTVKTHRKNIRKKLGLKNKKKNLAQYLKEIV